MPETTYCLEYYADEKGKEPFRDWLYGLRDRAAFARITVRLDRVELGNFGFCKSVGNGVFELKIDHGPGYRVYYAISGKTVVLLLLGGDKSTQTKDIETAKSYWASHRERIS
ncbi:type II toxin-antitoxin system RelE/ParE family toxin [Thiovibrio frasassiensis]|uniref:Type II toxin-antitoxin system RelE/ParE family toxin n=1 Tax=Thiovibrio frasassiensis TaxID=2984131 RepID=A0A9X4MLS2_9BACT|nr:type II toxin-antitoxin system RelE/ParE family toxin [Thiovibrio frasassiensis]MDG4475142.1 type II toxin-antitoxin system RelE/ParE family toxin [Thiovibrio frasassiensis]